MAQVDHGYRHALENLDNRLEGSDGLLPEHDDEDRARILNNRLTAIERQKASREKMEEDNDK